MSPREFTISSNRLQVFRSSIGSPKLPPCSRLISQDASWRDVHSRPAQRYFTRVGLHADTRGEITRTPMPSHRITPCADDTISLHDETQSAASVARQFRSRRHFRHAAVSGSTAAASKTILNMIRSGGAPASRLRAFSRAPPCHCRSRYARRQGGSMILPPPLALQ